MLAKLFMIAPFRSLEGECYECPTGTHGFYDAPADYMEYLGNIGVDSPPFANANPAFVEGDGWAITEPHPDV